MYRNYSLDDKYNQELLNIVEAFGGANCKYWTQVARLFYERTGLAETKSYNLKKRYQILTNYCDNINLEQEQILYETGIKCRGLTKAGLQEFQNKTGCNLYLGRYTQKIARFLQIGIKIISSAYIHLKNIKKKRFGSQFPRISYVDINIMLKAADIKEKIDDPIFIELQNSAIKLEQLFYQHVKCYDKNMDERYDHYMKVANRLQFKKLMFFLYFCGELKRISLNIFDKNSCFNHPLIKNDIELNKQSIYYQLLISQNDWKEKYDLFFNCTNQFQTNDQFSMLIKQAKKDEIDEYDLIPRNQKQISNKVANAQIECIGKQKKLRYFRGHYVQKGQIKTTGQTTIYFDHDVDSEEIENEDFEKEIQRQKEKEELEKQQEQFIKIYNQMFSKEEQADQFKEQKDTQNHKNNKLKKKTRVL
ncbi:unnamed protein product [Paramecium primaurelia]|uniref:Uncharacterized protein n=1 Tax=Paramecium primaurelia TaxID=5886 RepID=A0A8S1KKE5_PARPR|nr:unnamed protein product [Paramecium primaurelia]